MPAMPRRSTLGPRSRYRSGSQVSQTWGGSTTWSSTLMILGITTESDTPSDYTPSEPPHLRRSSMGGSVGVLASLTRAYGTQGRRNDPPLAVPPVSVLLDG